MSMNLISDKVGLRQTPTWITYLALYDVNQRKRTSEETSHIYVSWLKSTLNGVWDSSEELESARTTINSHIETLKEAMPLTFDII